MCGGGGGDSSSSSRNSGSGSSSSSSYPDYMPPGTGSASGGNNGGTNTGSNPGNPNAPGYYGDADYGMVDVNFHSLEGSDFHKSQDEIQAIVRDALRSPQYKNSVFDFSEAGVSVTIVDRQI